MTEYFNNCNSCCEGNLSVPPFDNYQCPQCDEENKPCETCGPQRPKWPCNCCEKDIMYAAPACCRPCWDTCKCMDEILGMKKCADKVKRELNNVNGRVTKVEKDIIDFNDNLSEAIGDLAEKEERDIVDVRNSIGAAVAVVQQAVNDERDRAIAKENVILDNLDRYIAYNDAALAAEIAARIAGDETEKADRIAADDAEKNARIASDTEERDARISGDNTLDYKINQLDQRLTTDLNNEIRRSTNKDNSLLEQLDAEIRDRIRSIDNESLDRIAADSLLQQNINNESNTRIEGDESLRLFIIQSINSEASSRLDGDAALQQSINNEVNDRIQSDLATRQFVIQSIDVESTNRINAINDEIQNRISGDNSLQQNINNETGARIEEDEAIRQLIELVRASLINYYTKGDTYNKNEVNQILEDIRRFQYKVVETLPTASDDTVGYIYLVPSPNPVTQNVKDEFITVMNTDGDPSDYYRWEQIGTTTVDLSPYSTTALMNQAIADAVAEEQARAVLKENDLETSINSEKARAQSAESTLLSNIDSEAESRLAADNTLDTKISDEKDRALSAEEVLQDSISTEKDRAVAAELTNATAISDELARATEAESLLQTEIGNESSRAQEAESSIQSDINAEKEARQAADSELDGKILAEEERAQGVEQALQDTINNAISNVSIDGNTITFTRIDGTSFTIDIPRLWMASGSTLIPIDNSKSVTASGFYDNTL